MAAQQLISPNNGAPLLPTLVTGANGQVGRELVFRGAAGLGREVLDLRASAADLREVALRLFEGAATVINAAAFTDVDGAEDPAQRNTVAAVNAIAPGVLAEAAAEVGAHFLHISTDYVFPLIQAGEHPAKAWSTTAAVVPTSAPNMYGQSKAQGEKAVLAHGGTVVRTAWVWSGPHAPGRDFVATMAELAARGVAPQVVDDQTGRPTYAPDLAAGLWSLVQQPGIFAMAPSILHFTNSGEPTTWCGLAREVFQNLGCDPHLVTPCASDQWPSPAQRPSWSVLDLAPWNSLLSEPPSWIDALQRGLSGSAGRVG